MAFPPDIKLLAPVRLASAGVVATAPLRDITSVPSQLENSLMASVNKT
jgi:hypothetical protein